MIIITGLKLLVGIGKTPNSDGAKEGSNKASLTVDQVKVYLPDIRVYINQIDKL